MNSRLFFLTLPDGAKVPEGAFDIEYRLCEPGQKFPATLTPVPSGVAYSQKPPNAAGYYWWRAGDDAFAFVVEIVNSWAGFLAAAGQHGWTRTQYVDEMGGWWSPVIEPEWKGEDSPVPVPAAVEGAPVEDQSWLANASPEDLADMGQKCGLKPNPAAATGEETFVKRIIYARKNRTVTEDRAKPEPQPDERALAALVKRLDEIHEDPAYQSVWTLHQIHHGPYKGPQYTKELEQARAALNQPKTVIDHGGDGKEFPAQ